MWTYLAILISLLIPIIIYIHKFHVYKINKNKTIEEKTHKEKIKEYKTETKEKVTKKEKTEAEIKYTKAISSLEDGDEEEGIKQLIQALALNPLHIKTSDTLAKIYIKKQMYSSASAILKQLINIEEKPEHYSHLGLAYYQQNLFEDAKYAYQQAIILDKDRPQRYISLAQVYRALKQPYNSIISINKALEYDSDNINYLLLLTELFNEVGDNKNAQKTIKKMDKINDVKLINEDLKS